MHLPVSSNVVRVGALGGSRIELEVPSLEASQQKCIGTRFVETLTDDIHPEVVVDHPKSLVEHPVGVLGEGEPIIDGVILGFAEGIDVGRIDD